MNIIVLFNCGILVISNLFIVFWISIVDGFFFSFDFCEILGVCMGWDNIGGVGGFWIVDNCDIFNILRLGLILYWFCS